MYLLSQGLHPRVGRGCGCQRTVGKLSSMTPGAQGPSQGWHSICDPCMLDLVGPACAGHLPSTVSWAFTYFIRIAGWLFGAATLALHSVLRGQLFIIGTCLGSPAMSLSEPFKQNML